MIRAQYNTIQYSTYLLLLPPSLPDSGKFRLSQIEEYNMKTPRPPSPISITDLGADIIYTHIINRLDGETLNALSCTSSELRSLCKDEDLWRKICTAKWPSLLYSIATDAISTFSGGFRSFFSQASLLLRRPNPPQFPRELICAIDLYHCCGGSQEGVPFYSRVERIIINDEWRRHQVNKYQVPSVFVPIDLPPVQQVNYEKWLEDNIRISWIIIDPSLKTVANVYSRKPLAVFQLGLNMHDFVVLYELVMIGDKIRGNALFFWCYLVPTHKVLCVKELIMRL